ncbi:MAG: polymer-forming cytoskeletal protein [Clostridium sp.]|uniref:polymer-forming cytoskeletal protein n=1 Tax=Clostridium sp. TaxID=1506 RepID=UPI00302D6D27
MEKNELVGDLKISGSGSANGGRYRGVSISGSGKIHGDVNCEKFNISGSGKVEGAVTTGNFNISGSGKVVGDLNCVQGGISGSGSILGSIHAKSFSISGTGKVGGNFKGEKFVMSGAGKVSGRINANIVKLMGAIRVGQGIEGESITIKGAVKTLGMVNGDDINIELNGGCEIEEIGATKVKVLRGYGNIIGRLICSIFSKNYGYLTTKTIEADEIYLENTIADVVRGGRIIIGDGCRIKRIEYSESLEITSTESIIEEEFKL